MRPKLILFVALIVLFTSSATQGQEGHTLTVFAASSLTNAFEEIATAFEADNPGVDVIYNFAGSSALATQLSEGAPADVFASANPRQMQVALEAERIFGEPDVFVHNLLVLITPADNPANIESLRDLAAPGIKFVVAAPEVPVRVYTDVMLARLASLPTYGNAYRSAVRANIVSEEDNVRQVFLKVALGEADAGIVYQSDVTPDAADQVLTIPIPHIVNSLATYPIAITNDSPNSELAQAFVDYVLSDNGQATLTQWGFLPVN
jgi:molybdate transport system substrate-binding protein